MKKNTIQVLLFTTSISMTSVAAEVPQTVPVQRFVATGSLVTRAPKVTMLANDPFVLQHIANVQRQARIPLPVTASTQQSSPIQVQVIRLDSNAVSSTVVNKTNAFLFQDITPPDTNSVQGATQVSTTQRLQQVEFYRRSIASQKVAAQ